MLAFINNITERQLNWFLFGLIIIGAAVGLACHDGSSYVVFNNDGPLGSLYAEECAVPSSHVSFWLDSQWLGGAHPARNSYAEALFICGPLLLVVAVILYLVLRNLRHTFAVLCLCGSLLGLSYVVLGVSGVIKPGFEPLWDFVPGLLFSTAPFWIGFGLVFLEETKE